MPKMHRRPQYFPAPERFDPTRWTSEFEAGLPRYAYMPFGGGPRICIGNSFATMEAQLLLATLARRFAFTLMPDQVVEPNPLVTLGAKYGMRMRVNVRRGSVSRRRSPCGWGRCGEQVRQNSLDPAPAASGIMDQEKLF